VCSPRHTNVGLMAYSPLAGGSLTGKYVDGTPEGARFTLFPGYMDRFNKSLAKDAVAEYVAVRAHAHPPSDCVTPPLARESCRWRPVHRPRRRPVDLSPSLARSASPLESWVARAPMIRPPHGCRLNPVPEGERERESCSCGGS